ncbi:tyrosine-protein kinase Etk/Wzc [Serratia fonticola]|jgi:tyrosine-protein kinase Etk/Wzc|uniref:Tyrosine-protein kinase Etk/Wzc n=1 Tax=Serratia fonticola TaxID=47917 RepID=A0A542BR31_SERFO|nr:polysaccharide biosynthesis tyrosine autokinase [Serratia fonticola]TQI81032.1 tyrosine-protein kinase Etk/Wzc [Serratia fonticola]TQI96944.1 tyrosine-protein kinase Etk/Wzc [Serratia fonticola]TVZ71439.1 tyrosine-protein kinase Etk/Wzc [Serratia fonticola]
MKNGVMPIVLAEQDEKLDWERLIGPLWDNRWRIVLVTGMAAVLGIAYALLATPIYQATTLVQVEQPNNSAALLQDSLATVIGQAPLTQDETALATSRYVMGKSVDALGLVVRVEADYFPLVGKGIARLRGETPPLLTISSLTVPDVMLGEKLTLKVLERQRFSLNVGESVLLTGNVGQPQQQGGWGIQVSKLEAEPGTTFSVVKVARQTAVDDLRKNLEIVSGGKDSGMLTFRLDSEDPQLAQALLLNITKNYLQQNIDRKTEEAERTLAFLQQQLPQIQSRLTHAENQLNLFRQQNDSVDLSLEAKSVLDTLVQLEAQLNELTFKEAEISKLYTREHPAYRALLEKRSALESEKIRLGRQVQMLPKTQQEILRMTRDVQVDQQVYLQLMNKQQEVSIIKAGTVGNIRIVDRAETTLKPVKPQKMLIVILAVLMGSVLSIAAVLLRTAFHRGINGSDVLEKHGINVYATVPLSLWQQRRNRVQQRQLMKNRGGALPVLALEAPGDLAVEAFRSLRTSLHFAKLTAKNNILLVSGASPASGKSFTSINLAIVLAQAGQRVLLIDGDMRKGFLHRWFNRSSKAGLSDMLAGQISLEEAIKATEIANLDFVPRGQVPPNPSELLMHHRLGDLLTGVGQHYDLVLIDTPPVLAVTDAAVIGHHAGMVLMVVRFAVNTLSQIEASIRRFEQNGVTINGVILNGVLKNTANETGYYPFAYPSHHESPQEQ